MERTKELQSFVDSLSLSFFGRANSQAIKDGICVSCGNPASSFNDEASAREFQISGLCQVCQDQVFDASPADQLPEWKKTVTDPIAYKAWVCHFLGQHYDADDWAAWQWILKQDSVILRYMREGLNPQEAADLIDSELAKLMETENE